MSISSRNKRLYLMGANRLATFLPSRPSAGEEPQTLHTSRVSTRDKPHEESTYSVTCMYRGFQDVY